MVENFLKISLKIKISTTKVVGNFDIIHDRGDIDPSNVVGRLVECRHDAPTPNPQPKGIIWYMTIEAKTMLLRETN